ncbi:hypothetical protein [Winogradskyella thalassocola]|uniref:Phosphate-selective porin O and P n=1 Tax=Winogradskyella thalassocola TaxID=262004 RepID=A0A1G8G6G8_9FLAO|nr:hypothetical protein [Winogradskyella thalassocola]SDH90007.1 Phosphate-selective porin O and P [Winogradskyella thalassocola]
MKSVLKLVTLVMVLTMGYSISAQTKNLRDFDNYRQPDQRGVNVFEAKKDTVTAFEELHVRIGGSFALQYQALDNENSGVTPLSEVGSNFNLATANLDLDVALYDGVSMHLRTYLSSRHHHEPYVKGGYFKIDKLDFISKGFMEDLMKHTTIKIGHMENNYGDAHFRRSDNAQAIHNPFVGNLIMDSFTTEVGAEVYYTADNGFFGMVGFSNGKLNQSTTISDGSTGGASFLAKLGFDKQINDDFRFRLSGSLYNTGYAPNVYLYSADRAGSRYYNIMQDASATSDNFRSGRFDPGFRNQITAIMINPFVKYGGLEFFGTVELASGKALAEADRRDANQYAGEVIYRFGDTENVYLGARYNTVSAELASGDDVSVDRFQLGAGWFLTQNVLMKAEYVVQKYKDYPTGNLLEDGQFDGLMLEAVISF